LQEKVNTINLKKQQPQKTHPLCMIYLD